MMLKVLHYVVYKKNGSWTGHDVQNPSWNDVETNVRRLDKSIYPFIWFYLTEESFKKQEPEFQVIGGKGDYYFGDMYGDRTYFNESGDPETEVWVWTSDQGFSTDEQHVCHDLETVVKVVKHFCEHGKFDPTVKWEMR